LCQRTKTPAISSIGAFQTPPMKSEIYATSINRRLKTCTKAQLVLQFV
jgi:hypothetical protein